MRWTTSARILAMALLAGLTGCALLFSFNDYGGSGGSGSGGSGGSGGGHSSGLPSSASSGMCDPPGSASSGSGGPSPIQIGGLLDDDVVAMDVDTAGSIVLAGTFKGTVDVDGATYNLQNNKSGLFLAEFDSKGAKLWSKLVATSPDTDPITAGVAIDPNDGSIILAGGFSGTVDFGSGPKASTGGTDVFVMKVAQDAGHTVVWSHVYTGVAAASSSAAAVAVGSMGHVVIAGKFNQDLSDDSMMCAKIDAGMNEDAFVSKLNAADGKCMWLRRTNSTMSAHADGVAVDGSDSVHVSGVFKGLLKPGTPAMEPLANGAQGDTFMVTYDPTGSPMFATHLAPAGAATVIFDSNIKALLFSGKAAGAPYAQPNQPYAGNDDIFAARYTTTGGSIFARLFGGPGDESAEVVALPDGSGNLVMGGEFQGTLPFSMLPPACAVGTDAFVAQLDPAGTPIAARTFGGQMNQAIRFIRAPATSVGNVVVAGRFEGTIDLGTGPLTSKGGYDIFVATVPIPQ